MIIENLEAIALLKTLQSDRQQPTKDELEILKQFNGWGAMWEIFKPHHPKHNELKFWLTESEFEAANASILNARYTRLVGELE
jgi:hypothetical protein